MVNVLHIYASNAKNNSGDFMIGIATKKYFQENIIKEKNIKFTDFDCRNNNLYNNINIEKLNNYDYIVVGSGGLILPDSGVNMISCWQWNISKENLKKIKKPIFVISIGWNLFFNQDMTMPSRENNTGNPKRLEIFKENIKTLIEMSKNFTLRHKSDVENLLKITGEKYREKVRYEMCPTVWYSKNYLKPNMSNNDKSFAIEIKDDREWRRYHKIGKQKYYNWLLNNVIKKHINKGEKIVYLSHDGSKNFYNFLKEKRINIGYLDNSVGNEKKILENYSKIHTIYCSAGHSQMISYGLGIKIISLVTHPKIRNFCDDIGDTNYIDVNNL